MGGSAAKAGTATVKSPMQIAAEANQTVDIQNQGQLDQQQKYGGQFENAYINSLKQSNPDLWNIQQGLQGNILNRVTDPMTGMNSQMMGQFDENVRAAQAQRGMGLSGGDAFQAALARSGYQNDYQMQNLGLAQNFLNSYRGPGSFLSNMAGTPQQLGGATNIAQTQDQARMQQEMIGNTTQGKKGYGQAIGSLVGGAGGFMLGGPAGAMAGAKVGGGAGEGL